MNAACMQTSAALQRPVTSADLEDVGRECSIDRSKHGDLAGSGPKGDIQTLAL